MNGIRPIRRGAIWLELLIVLAAIVFVFQLFPAIPQILFESLDFRYWSRSTWFRANLGVMVLLLVVRFGPSLIDSYRQRLRNRPTTVVQSAVQLPPREREDVRLLMRRDEEFRARLRRKLAFYGIMVPLLVIAAAFAVAWSKSEQELATRAASTLLLTNVGTDFRGDVQGVVGVKFRVRPDSDLRVTHLGVFDNSGDGLQTEYRTGVFRLGDESQKQWHLVAEVMVPYGNQATLEGTFRWVPLPTPVNLKAGTVYVIAAEAFSGVGDYWPGSFDETASAANTVDQAWNPLVVDDQTRESRLLLHTDQPWPAVPDRIMATTGVPHGPANMIVSNAE